MVGQGSFVCRMHSYKASSHMAQAQLLQRLQALDLSHAEGISGYVQSLDQAACRQLLSSSDEDLRDRLERSYTGGKNELRLYSMPFDCCRPYCLLGPLLLIPWEPNMLLSCSSLKTRQKPMAKAYALRINPSGSCLLQLGTCCEAANAACTTEDATMYCSCLACQVDSSELMRSDYLQQ